jgi:serine/threonine-protein kinase SRPK3
MTQYYVSYQSSVPSDCLDATDAASWRNIEETLDADGPGGFHPVQLGDIFGGRYEVVRKIGFGRESTVWLADDKRHIYLLRVLIPRNSQAVALKVIAARAGTVELENLLRLQKLAPEHPGHDHIPELLDHFEHKGPNGTHSCLVFEVLGEGIGWFCRRMFPNRHLPPTLDKMVVQQLITVLDFLHNICGFVHTGRILYSYSLLIHL